MAIPRITSNRYLVRKFIYEQVQKFTEGVNHENIRDILDVGCGQKPYAHFFTNPQKSYVGVDLRCRNSDVFAIGEMLPFRNTCFDVVLCTQVLEHVTEPKQVLDEIRRILKRNGFLVLSTHGFWVEGHESNDYWRWTLQGLERVISSAGFSIVDSASMDPFSSIIQTLTLWLPDKLHPVSLLLNCIGLSFKKTSNKGPRLHIVHIVKAVPK